MDLKKFRRMFESGEYLEITLKLCPPQDANPRMIAQIFDIMAASFFMIKDYNQAYRYYEQAMHNNPKVIDYHINLGVTLIKMGWMKQGIRKLMQAVDIVGQPTIYLFMKEFLQAHKDYSNAAKSLEMMQKLEKYNPGYLKNGGILLNFMKPPNCRIDNALIVQDALMDHLEEIDEDTNIEEHFATTKALFSSRHMFFKQFGFKYTDMDLINLLNPLMHFLILDRQIDKRILIPSQKKTYKQNMLRIYYDMLTYSNDFPVRAQLELFEESTSLYQHKYKRYRNNWEQYVLHSISDSTVATGQWGTASPLVHVTILPHSVFVFAKRHFVLNVAATKLKRIAETNHPQYKFLYDFYWLLLLKVFLNCQEGYDLDKFRRTKDAIEYMYEECGQHQCDRAVDVDNLYNYCESINTFYENFFVQEDKRKVLFQKWGIMENYYGEIIEDLQDFVSDEAKLSKFSSFKVSKSGEQFRTFAGLKGNYEDLLFENMCVFTNQMANIGKRKNQIVKTVLEKMIDPTGNNAKEMFFSYFKDEENVLSLPHRVWKQMCRL